MFIEFQFEKHKFLDGILSKIRSHHPCISKQFDILGGLETFLLNRLEFIDKLSKQATDSNSFDNIKGLSLVVSESTVEKTINTPSGPVIRTVNKVQILQPLRLDIVKLSDLKTNNTEESTPLPTLFDITPELIIVFDLEVDLAGCNPALSISYSDIIFPSRDIEGHDIDVPDQIKDPITSMVASNLPGQIPSKAFDLSA